MFYSCVIKILVKLQKDSQGREGGDLTNHSGSSQKICLTPASLPEGCWFLSSRRHITRYIKMPNTQLFLSNSVLLDKLHWRSSLCQECKSSLGSRGGKAACASQVPELFSTYSVLFAGCSRADTAHCSIRDSVFPVQGWYHWGQCASSTRLLQWSWYPPCSSSRVDREH